MLQYHQTLSPEVAIYQLVGSIAASCFLISIKYVTISVMTVTRARKPQGFLVPKQPVLRL